MSELSGLSGTGLLLAIVTAVSAAGLFAAASLVMLDRADLRSKLRGIDDLYNLIDARDQEIVQPVSDRLAAPVLGVLGKVGRRFSPAHRIEATRVMLRRAGRYDADTDRY